MGRLQKKCLVASVVMHVFLLLLLVLGSAFFVPSKKKTSDLPLFKVVPRRFVDDALSGGGGNPKIAPSDAQQKGETLVAQPPPPPPVAQPPPPKPQQSVEPLPVKKLEPVKKPEPVAPAKKPTPKPTETAKKPMEITPAKAPLELKPTTRKSTDVAKQQRDAEVKKAAEAGKQLARELSKTRESLVEGFQSGTKVEISGPGGEAYVNYAQWVKTVYEDAWQIPNDLLDEDSTAKVVVTIARSGDVLSARIERRSGNSTLDKSVQRTLDKVRFVAPFPDGAKEEQRTFTINFNLKAKLLSG